MFFLYMSCILSHSFREGDSLSVSLYLFSFSLTLLSMYLLPSVSLTIFSLSFHTTPLSLSPQKHNVDRPIVVTLSDLKSVSLKYIFSHLAEDDLHVPSTVVTTNTHNDTHTQHTAQ